MSRDYSKYEIEDFAFDESFQKWVLGENSGQPGFWEDYIIENPHQTDKILAARLLVQELSSDENATELYADLKESVWEEIQDRVATKKVTFWNRFSAWKIAASILLASAAMIGSYRLATTLGTRDTLPKALAAQSKDRLFEEVNRTDNVLKINLEDGTRVSLSKNSRLIYPKKFGPGERIVQLKGEAFFEVARDANHPFLIYANETVTKVLGTSFRIRAFQTDPSVVVSVTTGKVSVFAQKDMEQNAATGGVVLTANQQAEFTRSQQHFTKSLVENPIVLAGERDIQFDFNDTPLKQVFDSLQAAYGVEIIYNPELVENRTLRVNLGNESLYEKLNVVCNTMGMSYQVVDTKIIIETKSKPDS
jgi:transmembrane sensor